MNPENSEIIIYQTDDGKTRIEVRMENETVWLMQAQMAELFEVTVPTINEHLKGIYAEAELAAAATIRKFRIVRLEGGGHREHGARYARHRGHREPPPACAHASELFPFRTKPFLA